MPYLDTIKLAFGNSLILGNTPDAVSLEQVARKIEQENLDIQSFGLFDSNTANYNTYYPDVTAEDFTPKDSDFITPTFRALSEVVVHKNWNPVDFGVNGVLKKSLSLLKGQTINADHETSIGNAMGAVADVAWQESFKQNGVMIPAGINAKLKIDAKSHPRVARAIMMDPPSIHSTSVTVQFLWEKSHASLTEEEFFRSIGTFDKDGKLIRRIATRVQRYNEISLVSHGADPFAQKMDKGGINNPLWADVSYNSAKPGERKATKFFMFDFKSDVVSNSEENSIPTETNNNSTQTETNMDKQFLLALAAVLGMQGQTEESITNEAVQTALAERLTAQQTLQQNFDNLQQEFNTYKEQNPVGGTPDQQQLTALQGQVNTFTESFRAEVLKNYNILAAGAPVASIVELLGKADYSTLKAMNEGYAVELEQKYPISCKKCGSTEVNRASSSQEEGQDDKGTSSFTENPADYAQRLSLKRANQNANAMHGGK